MLKTKVVRDAVHIGERFSVNFQRTLRIPDDGGPYPLPPGLGSFPIFSVRDYLDTVPESWRNRGGFFIPIYQREAMWMSFRGADWKPNAVKIAIGGVNAVSGTEWDERLSKESEDYITVPEQPWLDGINAGDGYIRQFVAMPLGSGYTVEGQITGEEKFGGIQIVVYEPKPGRFPDEPPVNRYSQDSMGGVLCLASMPAEMGLAAGGRMRQKIYPDPYGLDTWDEENYGSVKVHIVNSEVFEEITGLRPPTTPVSAKTYTQYGFPWFDLLDEHKEDIKAPQNLSDVRSVKEMDGEKGAKLSQDDEPVHISGEQVEKLKDDS